MGQNLATQAEVFGTGVRAFLGVARAIRCSSERARACALTSYRLLVSLARQTVFSGVGVVTEAGNFLSSGRTLHVVK